MIKSSSSSSSSSSSCRRSSSLRRRRHARQQQYARQRRQPQQQRQRRTSTSSSSSSSRAAPPARRQLRPLLLALLLLLARGADAQLSQPIAHDGQLKAAAAAAGGSSTKFLSRRAEHDKEDDAAQFADVFVDAGQLCPLDVELRWMTEVSSSVYATPLVTDLYADGRKDVIVPGFVHYTEVLEGPDGAKALGGWPGFHRSTVHTSPLLYDVDADGVRDVLVATYDGEILFFKDNGERMFGYSMTIPRLRVKRDWYVGLNPDPVDHSHPDIGAAPDGGNAFQAAAAKAAAASSTAKKATVLPKAPPSPPPTPAKQPPPPPPPQQQQQQAHPPAQQQAAHPQAAHPQPPAQQPHQQPVPHQHGRRLMSAAVDAADAATDDGGGARRRLLQEHPAGGAADHAAAAAADPAAAAAAATPQPAAAAEAAAAAAGGVEPDPAHGGLTQEAAESFKVFDDDGGAGDAGDAGGGDHAAAAAADGDAAGAGDEGGDAGDGQEADQQQEQQEEGGGGDDQGFDPYSYDPTAAQFDEFGDRIGGDPQQEQQQQQQQHEHEPPQPAADQQQQAHGGAAAAAAAGGEQHHDGQQHGGGAAGHDAANAAAAAGGDSGKDHGHDADHKPPAPQLHDDWGGGGGGRAVDDDEYPLHDGGWGDEAFEQAPHHDHDPSLSGGHSAEPEHVYLDAHVLATPAIGDIDGDGHEELVVAVSYFYDSEYYGDAAHARELGANVDKDKYVAGGIVVFDLSLRIMRWQQHLDLTTATTKFTAHMFGSPTLADLDGDGRLEIVVGTSVGFVYALDTWGHAKPGWPVQMGEVQGQPLVADVDADGAVEVFVGDSLGNVALLDKDGRELWERHVKSMVGQAAVAGDIDGDGLLEIVFGSADGRVHALRGVDGSLVPGFPFQTGGRIQAQATIAPLHASPPPGSLTGAFSRVRRGVGSTVGGELKRPSQHIAVMSFDGFLYLIDGASACAHVVDIGEASYAAVLVDDLTGEGTLDLLVATMNGNVYSLATRAPYHPLATWPSQVLGVNGLTARTGHLGFFATADGRRLRDVAGHAFAVQVRVVDERPPLRRRRSGSAATKLDADADPPRGPYNISALLKGVGVPEMNAGAAPVIGVSDALPKPGAALLEMPCPRTRTTAAVHLDMALPPRYGSLRYVDEFVVSFHMHFQKLLKYLVALPLLAMAWALVAAAAAAADEADGGGGGGLGAVVGVGAGAKLAGYHLG